MNETTKTNETFIGYEYKEVLTTREMEGVYADSYPSFGWILDSCTQSPFGVSVVNLKFKRNRKIRNKAELTRLQRQFEAGVAEIGNLEQSKTIAAFATALGVGLGGTAFLAGATFAIIFAEMIPLMIILAIPGFIGWGLPYLLYKKIKAQKSAMIVPLIEKQYDEINKICEKGHALLA